MLTQALAKHIEQLVALPDELRRETIARYKQLCDTCGCHNEQELSEALSVERKPRRCPLARFLRLRVCGQLGVQARLSACLSLGKAEREASWHSLLMHLSRRASASDADAGFRSDVELVTASWAAIRRCFRGQGVRQPRQLVLDPRVQPAVWLIPHSISRRPRWLEELRLVLSRVDAAALFPRLDRGCNPTCAPAHQVLLSEVILGLRSPSAPVAGLFESELWDQVRSTAPLCSWINRIRKHGLVSTVEADDLSFRSTGPIWDLVTLGRYPNVSRALLQHFVMWLAQYLRTVQTEAVADQAGQGPLMWSYQPDPQSCRVPLQRQHSRCGPVLAIQRLHERLTGLYNGRGQACGNHLSGEMESPDNQV